MGLYMNETIAMQVLVFKHKQAGHVAVLMLSKRDNDWMARCDCGVLFMAFSALMVLRLALWTLNPAIRVRIPVGARLCTRLQHAMSLQCVRPESAVNVS